jgi:hypothetical protein
MIINRSQLPFRIVQSVALWLLFPIGLVVYFGVNDQLALGKSIASVLGVFIIGPPLSLASESAGIFAKAGTLVGMLASLSLACFCYRNIDTAWGKLALPVSGLLWLLSMAFTYAPA